MIESVTVHIKHHQQERVDMIESVHLKYMEKLQFLVQSALLKYLPKIQVYEISFEYECSGNSKCSIAESCKSSLS